MKSSALWKSIWESPRKANDFLASQIKKCSFRGDDMLPCAALFYGFYSVVLLMLGVRIRIRSQLVDQIGVYLGTLVTPVVADRDGQTAGGNIELQIQKGILPFLDDAVYRVFLILIGIVVRIDLGLILQVDPFFLEVVQDVLLYGIGKPVFEVEQSFLTQICDLIMLGISDGADGYKACIDHFA